MIDAATLAYPDDRAQHGRDVSADRDALPLNRLEAFLTDIRREPPWRREADLCADYYDSKQDTPEQVAALAEAGLGALVDNLVKPTVDAVLGMEARTRTDWRVTADDEAHQPVAEALSAKLAEAERESRADRACADAYAQMVKTGFGCVEVSRPVDPFAYPYRVRSIHRREIFWDWRSQQPDWSDARFVMRKRWTDVDAAMAYFPEHRDLIDYAVRGWDAYSFEMDMRHRTMNADMLTSAMDTEQRTSIEELEWRQVERHRLAIYECWYQTHHRGHTFRTPDGRVIEYDAKNAKHVALMAAGVVQPRIGVWSKWRLAYFIGPHRISDTLTKRRHQPYVPFFGYREDRTSAPYGLIRSMLSVQDEINARRRKMMQMLSSRRVMIDSDALDTEKNDHTAASAEFARHDAYIVLNPDRRNANAVIVQDSLELADTQFRVLQEAKQTVQQVSGVYAALMGQQSNASSGLAIQSLIDQGTMTLAEINDNYAFGRRLVGERLLDLVREDLAGAQEKVFVDNGVTKRPVMLNVPTTDPATGEQVYENDTELARVKVALADIPQTPAYRQQQATQMAEVIKSLPPDMQPVMVPFLLELTDLPNRREIAKLLREKLGLMDPDDPQAQQAQQAMQAQQQEAAQLQKAAIEAEVAEKQAKADKTAAEAEKVRAETAATLNGEARADADRADREVERDIKLQESAAQREAETERERIRAEAQIESRRMASDPVPAAPMPAEAMPAEQPAQPPAEAMQPPAAPMPAMQPPAVPNVRIRQLPDGSYEASDDTGRRIVIRRDATGALTTTQE